MLRSRYGRDGASVAVLVAIVADHVVLLGLAARGYAATGGVSAYAVAIVALLLDALTAGRRDVARVDPWAKRGSARGLAVLARKHDARHFPLGDHARHDRVHLPPARVGEDLVGAREA